MRNKTRKFKEGIIARGLHRHPLVVPVVTFIGLCFLTMVGFVILGSQSFDSGSSHVVQLSADNKKQTVPTRASTVGDFLTRAQITLHEGDVVEPAVDATIDSDDFRVNVYRAKPVTIIDGDERIQALSAATTPRSVAEQVGIEVFPEDNIDQVATTEFLRDQSIGTQLIIDRAIPIHLNLYGTPITIRTQATTVEELLAEKNIVLVGGDSVKPRASSKLKKNTQVFVIRSGTKLKTIKEAIPMETEIIEDASLSFGSTAVRQKGSPGQQLVTYEIKLENGREVSRKTIQKVVVKKPVPQIIARGPQGSFGQALMLLRNCESGGNYQTNTGNGFYGAYQFEVGTWRGIAPSPYNQDYPHEAPAAAQDIAATTLYRSRGWQPWPGCTAKLGLQDIYR